MSIETVSLALFTAFFAVSFAILLRRDTFVAGVYLFLFIYTIFAQIGYLYFPELADQLSAYFGREVFLPYTAFVALSFLTFCLMVLSSMDLMRGISYGVIRRKVSLYGWLFWFILLIHIAWLASFFVLNYDVLNYVSASDESFSEDQGLPYVLFGIAFKLSVGIVIGLYVLMRLRGQIRPNISAKFIPLFLLIEAVLLISIATRLGNRTDLLAVMLGVCVFEYQLGGGIRKFLKLSLITGAALYVLILVYESRFSDPVEKLLYEAILVNDYFAPAHILFAAIHYNLIDPVEVLTSNALNALVKFGHPYLQTTVMELFIPGIANRSQSYAFYIPSEGFLVLGTLGFLYNGIVIGSGVMLWRALAQSEDRAYSLFMLTLISTQMANVVRGQSSYFIKDIYVFFLPAMALFFLASGLRPAFRPLRRITMHATPPNNDDTKGGGNVKSTEAQAH